MASQVDMSNCNFFSDPIVINNSCIDLDLPTGSQVVDNLCSLLPVSSQQYIFKNNSDHPTPPKIMLPVQYAFLNSDSQYSFTDDDVIPNDHPKCFQRLEECAPDSALFQSSNCMIFRNHSSPIKSHSPVFQDMSSQYLRPPGQTDDTASLHDSLDDDEDKRTTTSVNSACFFYNDGLFLPIDDDEFALVQPDPNDFGNHYTVQTGVNPNTNTALCQHISPYHRSVSFNSGKPKKLALSPVEPPRRNSDTYRSNFNVNFSTTSTVRSSTPENRVIHPAFVYESESEDSVSYCDTYSKTDPKEKPPSIFDNNGLFINKEHPLFLHKFSRKVFIGGLPRDISIGKLFNVLRTYREPLYYFWSTSRRLAQQGSRKNAAKRYTYLYYSGFAFLHFENYASVEKLYESVSNSKNRNKYSISSSNIRSKEVEVKFWRTNDCECFIEEREKIDPFLTVFVGALPRTTTALELASFMERVFNHVAYAAIDVDVVYGYPKGAGRVTFVNKEALAKALKSHFIDMDINHGGKKKRIEIKPFISNDQKCDICCSQRNNQIINKYCYLCESFICENCESDKCLDGTPHDVTTRPKVDSISLGSE